MSLPGYDLLVRMREEAARQAGMTSQNVSSSLPSPSSSGGDIAARGKDEGARAAADIAESSANAAQRQLIGIGIAAAVLVGVVLYLRRK